MHCTFNIHFSIHISCHVTNKPLICSAISDRCVYMRAVGYTFYEFTYICIFFPARGWLYEIFSLCSSKVLIEMLDFVRSYARFSSDRRQFLSRTPESNLWKSEYGIFPRIVISCFPNDCFGCNKKKAKNTPQNIVTTYARLHIQFEIQWLSK